MNEGYQQGKGEIKKKKVGKLSVLPAHEILVVVATLVFNHERKRKGESDKGWGSRPRSSKVKNLKSRGVDITMAALSASTKSLGCLKGKN